MMLLCERQDLRALGSMRMLAPSVNFELGQEHPAQAVFGNHTAHRMSDEPLGIPGANLRDRPVFFAALPTGVTHELFGGLLFAREANLLGIDDHNKVARIQVRRIDGLVLTAQHIGKLRRQAAQHDAVGVNHMPLALVQIHFRQMRLHLNS